MGRSNRNSTPNRRQRRQQARAPYEPVGKVEYPGVMGWMQRNMRWFIMIGLLFILLSTFAFAIAPNLNTTPADSSTPTPTATTEATATGTPTEEPIQRSYSAAPAMSIDTAKSYRAIIHLESGDVVIELLADEAPNYVNNFVFLARNRFYDGLRFHRVIEGFVAQAGDPAGTGNGGPGYILSEERSDAAFDRGVISMAKSSAGVSGSQFFITLRPTPELTGDFTVFGRVVEGMDLLDGLTLRDPRQSNQPQGDLIQSIEIVEE